MTPEREAVLPRCRSAQRLAATAVNELPSDCLPDVPRIVVQGLRFSSMTARLRRQFVHQWALGLVVGSFEGCGSRRGAELVQRRPLALVYSGRWSLRNPRLFCPVRTERQFSGRVLLSEASGREGDAKKSQAVATEPSQQTPAGRDSAAPWWRRLQRAWEAFREGARTYTRGSLQLYRNMKQAGQLEKRLSKGGHEALSYPEHLLLIQTRHDRLRAFLLLSVSLISTALIPVLAEAIPGFKPTTFTTEEDRQMQLRMQGIRYIEAHLVLWRALATRTDPEVSANALGTFPCVESIAAETLDGALRSCSRPELIALCRLFAQPAFPISFSRSLRKRLARHFTELACLDDALQRDGLQTLTQSQLEDACLMRALPAYDRSGDEMRGDLELWLQRSRHGTRELFQMIADTHLQNAALLGWSAPLLRHALGEHR